MDEALALLSPATPYALPPAARRSALPPPCGHAARIAAFSTLLKALHRVGGSRPAAAAALVIAQVALVPARGAV